MNMMTNMARPDRNDPTAGDRIGDGRVDDEPREVSSAELLGGVRRLNIRHAGETYTLRLTRQNKLLLTK